MNHRNPSLVQIKFQFLFFYRLNMKKVSNFSKKLRFFFCIHFNQNELVQNVHKMMCLGALLHYCIAHDSIARQSQLYTVYQSGINVACTSKKSLKNQINIIGAYLTITL